MKKPTKPKNSTTKSLTVAKKTTPVKMGRPIEWDHKAITVERIALEKWIDNPDNYFFTSFLNERKLDPKQVERFAEMNHEFCQTYTRAKRIQEQRLVELAVTRKGDPNFIKFVLQNKSGWKEKQEVSGDAANPLSIIMDRIAQSSQDTLDYYLDE